MVIPAAKLLYHAASESIAESAPDSAQESLIDKMMSDMIKQWRQEILLSEGGTAEENKLEW